MATDNTDTFAAEAAEERPTRADLERQLAELGDTTDTEDILDADEDLTVDVEDEEDEAPVEWITIESDIMPHGIRISKPTDVAVTLFQQDMSSRVATDNDKIVLMGDFSRKYVHPQDFYEWRTRIEKKAARNPREAFGVFWHQNEAIVEALLNSASNTDEEFMQAELNRAEKRAALKKKKARLQAGKDRR